VVFEGGGAEVGENDEGAVRTLARSVRNDVVVSVLKVWLTCLRSRGLRKWKALRVAAASMRGVSWSLL
jgi:hypothetical protein